MKHHINKSFIIQTPQHNEGIATLNNGCIIETITERDD